jgi:zeaxanthin glucosyltransferase
MSHYGIVVPPYTGHLNPILVLARALQARGHRVTLISLAEASAAATAAGCDFQPVARLEFPPGRWHALTARAGGFRGLRATAAAAHTIALFVRGTLRELPAFFTRRPLDGLVMDQTCVGVESLADVWGIPLGVACCALPLHFDAATPPPYFLWRAGATAASRLRNFLGLCVSNATAWRVVNETTRFRIRHGRPAMGLRYFNELKPSLVQVAQQPAAFDFSGRRLPSHFHYTAPWVEERVESSDFPWQRLDGRPLIYASLGTLQNRMADVYRVMIDACRSLPVQTVVSLGRSEGIQGESFADGPIVVGFAPQKALLRKAVLTLCHGGLNTTLESLRVGIPVVAIPITNDQPGVAMRLESLGLGACMPLHRLDPVRLRTVIRLALDDSSCRSRAAAFSKRIASIDGPTVAASLLETAFTTGRRIDRCRE